MRQAAPNSRVWAVIKADAYGHGVAQVALTLNADGFAVARLDEARRLRDLAVTRPILVMGGVYSGTELEEAARLDLNLALHDERQLGLVADARPARPLKVWLKINTGMNRLGLPADLVPQWLKRLEGCPALDGAPGLMTHLADADDRDDPLTERQCRRLRESPGADGLELNIGNSGGLLGWTAARTDWVRPGIMLYGISPFLNETGVQRDLRPVMTLSAPLIAVNRCRKGERLGYGGTYQCPEDMPVGIIAIGYGDGYPRHAPSGTPVLLNSRRVPLVGRVSMDTIMVDLRGLPAPDIGDQAILWGRGLPAEEIAFASETIAYELLTGVTQRVRHEHINLKSSVDRFVQNLN